MDDFVFNNKFVQGLLETLKNQDGSIDEKKCELIIHQLKNEKAVAPLRDKIRKKYTDLLEATIIKDCAKHSCQDEVSFSPNALQKACYEIEADLCILLSRRKSLIGEDVGTGISLISQGKIAGVTTYRLAKTQIIHLSSRCLHCYQEKLAKKEKLCSVSTLNTELAVICGLEFIGKSYSKIHKDVRNEILYTLINRHTNQETLGIIFDTLKTT